MRRASIFEKLRIDDLSRDNMIRIVRMLIKKNIVRPKKRYGQHFLIDPRAMRCIIDLLRGRDRVLEIGPGPGILTYIISHVCRHVVGVEIDRSFIGILRELCEVRDNVDVVISDALHIYFPYNIDVFSNLPFYITSDIIVKLVRDCVRRAVLTVQKEVADRLVASPGSHSYGRLTVLVQCFYNVRKVYVIDRFSFYPAPEVNGCVIVLERKEKPCISVSMLSVFEKVTATLFSFRNKNVDKVLRRYLNVQVPPHLSGKRVFELSIEDVVSIVELVGGRVE
ncbi:MAG: ribosomal RNA small subunit methyltransferase A [Crenarchaeota archaeon]|nr:ribosomal RNA small subunit methyltransferase A [Thermoproteota archaeon]